MVTFSGDGKLLRVLKAFYGLTDAGDYWHRTVCHVLVEWLKMRPFPSDQSFYSKNVDGKQVGLAATQVNDIIGTGDKAHNDDTSLLEKSFESNPSDCPFHSPASPSRRQTNMGYILEQPSYAGHLPRLTADTTFDEFRSLRHQVSWLCQTMTYRVAIASICSQVTAPVFNKINIEMLNMWIARAHDTPNLGITIPCLALSSLRTLFYADASFTNNAHHSTQMGYIVLLNDDTSRAIQVCFSSYKSHRVVRSVFSSELYAQDVAVDLALVLRSDLRAAQSRNLPVVVLTDSLRLLNVVIRTSTITTEKSLMIDIAAIREASENQEIAEIGWIRTAEN